MIKKGVKIFQTPFETAEALAMELLRRVEESNKKGRYLTIALSGGKTPTLLFTVLADHFAGEVKWNNTHFFWADERMVDPDHPESNFGMAFRTFLIKVDIPAENIHRIMGENDVDHEVARYSAEVGRYTEKQNGLPVFDIILLVWVMMGIPRQYFLEMNSFQNRKNMCQGRSSCQRSEKDNTYRKYSEQCQ